MNSFKNMPLNLNYDVYLYEIHIYIVDCITMIFDKMLTFNVRRAHKTSTSQALPFHRFTGHYVYLPLPHLQATDFMIQLVGASIHHW